MRMHIGLFIVVLTAGCSVMGYRDVADLKTEAKYSVTKQIDGDPVIVYRDIRRALDGCTRQPGPGPYRTVVSELDRQTDRGEVSLKHQSRFIAHYEITKLRDGVARVSGWWLIGAAMCQPSF